MKQERTMQEAARRYARLQSIDCTRDEEDAALAWKAEAPEHRKAYELAEHVGALVADERLNQKLRALADEAFAAYASKSAVQTPARAPRRWHLAAGLAASIAVAVIAVWQIMPLFDSAPSMATVYEETSLERRAVTLADGSMVRLDVNSRIAIRLSSDRRQIDLLSGRALFEVAHDSSRPFSVTAAGSRTTALGTKFQVQRDAERVIVTLTEGSVAVDPAGQRSASTVWHERLIPGEQLSIDGRSRQRLRQFVDVNVITGWTQGRHIFRGTPLHAAIDEVNRYAARKVRLGDPSLANLPVSGNFIVGDSEVVLDAFAAVLPLRSVEAGDREIILFRDHGR